MFDPAGGARLSCLKHIFLKDEPEFIFILVYLPLFRRAERTLLRFDPNTELQSLNECDW